MQVVNLTTRLNKDWSGHFVDKENYDQLFDEEVTVYKPDGKLLLKVLKGALSVGACNRAWKTIEKYNVKTNNRSIAVGAKTIREVKGDGTISNTTRVPKGFEVVSGTLGFFERTPRFPYCRACQFNIDEPEKFANLLPVAEESSRLFLDHGDDRAVFQRVLVEKTSKDFVIPGTVFTTITLNKNFRTAAHLDAGDLPDGISCMALLSRGKWMGAHLVYPDFRVAVKLEDRDLIIFDPHEYHANTPLIPLGKNHCRSTLVFYYRDKIQHCKSAVEELDRAKNRKLGESLT